ncbi:MAG TPA: polysaccharide deacetylase family protein [Pirellulales bacterium]|nr:polysaccharide deacetylase family protein [Pirellulales bacterium]
MSKSLSAMSTVSRRRFLAGSAGLAGCALGLPASVRSRCFRPPGELDEARRRLAADEGKALVAITLDLEMSRNFPQWEITHWDYEKGNLNAETKQYSVEAARRVKAAGGVLHFFCVARVLEQENVEWLKQLATDGHPIGNHTYDHVYVLATRPEDVQYRFTRAPWLIEGKSAAQAIAENVRLANVALKERVNIDAAGFRTPGGFSDGLEGRADVQEMLLAQGFTWVSSKYPSHAVNEPGTEPPPEVFESILKAQERAQPFVYPSGLIEVPMSPISDIGAFRGGRWKLESFLKAVRMGIEWAIDRRAVFDLLAHPSCLYVTDPEFRAVDLACELVRAAGQRAAIVDLATIAERARLRQTRREP